MSYSKILPFNYWPFRRAADEHEFDKYQCWPTARIISSQSSGLREGYSPHPCRRCWAPSRLMPLKLPKFGESSSGDSNSTGPQLKVPRFFIPFGISLPCVWGQTRPRIRTETARNWQGPKFWALGPYPSGVPPPPPPPLSPQSIPLS